MRTFSHQLLPAVGLLVAACSAPAVHAQVFKDPALQALYAAEKTDELQRVAQQRVATQADDAQAVLALALTALNREDAPARQTVLKRAEACIDKQPKAAPCHYALGVVLGVQALSEGMFKAARSAGTVREALVTAQTLEPAWYPARAALLEFYVQAPGMMGGSTSKAAELAKTAPSPEQARALEARLAMSERKFDVALQLLNTLPGNLEPALADDVHAWAVQCGLGMVNLGQAAKAQPAMEKLVRDQAERAGPVYALARVRGELGAHEEALKLYEQAATLKGAPDWPIAYRAGIAQQQLGQKEAAKASFTRFVSAGKGQKASLEDARKRLEQLGG
jgi:tetratricopeptide (TPR) repeat protein